MSSGFFEPDPVLCSVLVTCSTCGTSEDCVHAMCNSSLMCRLETAWRLCVRNMQDGSFHPGLLSCEHGRFSIN